LSELARYSLLVFTTSAILIFEAHHCFMGFFPLSLDSGLKIWSVMLCLHQEAWPLRHRSSMNGYVCAIWDYEYRILA
jgi:hypothetical protein